MKKLNTHVISLVALVLTISACTKKREAALPEQEQASVFAISDFGNVNSVSDFSAKVLSANIASDEINKYRALNTDSKVLLSAENVTVPERMRYMFQNLPILNTDSKEFKLTFSVDKDYVTAYKIASDIKQLNLIEKSIGLTVKQIELTQKESLGTIKQSASVLGEKKSMEAERDAIASEQKQGTLLIPLFKYKIESYGRLSRTKNDLKEETAKLELKKTNWSEATHIKISSQSDARLVIAATLDQGKILKNIYSKDKINHQQMSVGELQKSFKVHMDFLGENTKVFTKLNSGHMLVYEITSLSNLSSQENLLLKRSDSQQVLSCRDPKVSAYIQTQDANCVLVLRAQIPITYKKVTMTKIDESGVNNQNLDFDDTLKAESSDLVEIKKNTVALAVGISDQLDYNKALKISDLNGEFFFRRTFEDASNLFLGRTGTSGDLHIVKFELEDKRLVVRNQQSLIAYTGQGAKDREELMSFPVKYIKLVRKNAAGSELAIPVAEETTKDKAEFISIDWTTNQIPDSTSPLAFYSGGSCFQKNSALTVTDMDMRLAQDGVLNFSLAGSYTVRPSISCVTIKETNSTWGDGLQFNFNITERLSFKKHKDVTDDKQFSANLSNTAQSAFNYAVFTLADKVTGGSALDGRHGSEKYMPVLQDFRNGRVVKYHVGGINNKNATDAKRRQLIVEATKQVAAEWNKIFRYAFRGTSLARSTDYIEVVFDDETNSGHLGDLDRNYIWYQELPAENGLLGVAQPAANPRSGKIQSSNVIVYSGNTFEQTKTMLKLTDAARKYEKMVEALKAQAIEEAKKQNTVVSTAEILAQKEKMNAAPVEREIITPLSSVFDPIQNYRIETLKQVVPSTEKLQLSAELFKNRPKGRQIPLDRNSDTALLKLLQDAKLSSHPAELELLVNNYFLKYESPDLETKNYLKKRADLLQASIKFDENTKNRIGCFSYSRQDVNELALNLSSDPETNLMLNFKKNLMSTLSHELGHAFGLMHNFKGSFDKNNFEFPEENTGRNYSSIMDYIADVDMNYKGPGPYDAYALRAAYTGYVEVSEAAAQVDVVKTALGSRTDRSLTINELLKALEVQNTSHLSKDTFNSLGVLKRFEQCNDYGVGESSLCARFDLGGSATEIVQNLVQDYYRNYNFRYHVQDKIKFGMAQKIQLIRRNISRFQQIRSFLEELIISIVVGTGLNEKAHNELLVDQIQATKLAYNFFHDLIRIPDLDVSASNVQDRFLAVPYEVKLADGKIKQDIRILEARSLSDINLSRDKFDTIGTAYDKTFALMFLLQATAASKGNDDVRLAQISFVDFEQFFLQIKNPLESPTILTLLKILSDNLTAGFYPDASMGVEAQLIELNLPIKVTRTLREQSMVSGIVGLSQSAFKDFDLFAEMFKVGKSTLAQAPTGRPFVTKLGQSKTQSDTKVLYASQNAFAAAAMIERVARLSAYQDHEQTLLTLMSEMLKATSKEASEAAAKNMLTKLRELNKDGILLPLELDQANSPVNFEKQTLKLQQILFTQMKAIMEIKKVLEATPESQLQTAIAMIKKTAEEIKKNNEKLESIPLFLVAFSFINKVSENIEIKLTNQKVVSASAIAKLLMPANNMASDITQQTALLEKMSELTTIVDPDLVQR